MPLQLAGGLQKKQTFPPQRHCCAVPFIAIKGDCFIMKPNIKVLNGNMLKIIAAILMVVDHVGLMFFPQHIVFRIIGRLSFPIFAFMIAEGARYTRNKAKYILMIGGLGFICQLAYFLFANDLYMCILVTFTLSIAMIYALQYFKKCLFSTDISILPKILSGILFIATVAAVYVLNIYLQIDYGFYGCMVPIFASFFDFRGIDLHEKCKWLDSVYLRIGGLAVGLCLLAFSLQGFGFGGIQWFSLLSILILLCYSGERGRVNLKYFFYIFYPVHLVMLEGIAFLLMILK